MERFNRHVGALDGPLQETPEVLQAISVNLSLHVLFGMVDHAVDTEYEEKATTVAI